ncbi:pro-interleukin-16-like [Phymastichus coffea]|uniref:pro-interleukin-16-like n=1 Tax=Phymastichus coffea TaxID=108790 RepID=UPI00273C66AE|nr:pro-interleukin-16-like [Phymastichus coffea]
MDSHIGGGGQRLPPDGDEFPLAYQEYTTTLSNMDSIDGTMMKSIYTEKRMVDVVSGYYESSSDSPPPLPSSNPPVRKFSANGDLWRQDNKSEKSVKDKIAMFSSQQTIGAPSFPSRGRLSKHKSSDDVFAEEKSTPERAQSSFDLSNQKAPSLPQTSPPPTSSFNGYRPTYPAPYIPSKSPTSNGLTRATSFSGSYANLPSTTSELSAMANSSSPPTVARTNSLASTFRRPSDEARKSSLNQLIEQRRKGISKLRGLVIPEKDAVPVDQPITDLPEIKSRDSILVSQVSRANIQDKWGSQSSIASNASTVSSSLRPNSNSNSNSNNNSNNNNNTFKMPAPKILSSYSPAFKRKSLSVYSPTTTTVLPSNNKPPQQQQLASPDAPKSLESICSPTRSDYSFDFVSSSASPDNGNPPTSNKPKGRNEYADSDNDSAVSSSQSSISRGFSPEPASYQLIVPEKTSVYTARTQFLSERSFFTPEKPSKQPQLKRSESTSESLRILKPQSVEAINRKNILASARCRSGRDLNLGSPLIQRKFSDEEEDKNEFVGMTNGNGEAAKPEIKIAYIEITENVVASEEKKEDEVPRLPPKRNAVPSARNQVPIPTARSMKSELMEPSNDMKSWMRAEMRTLTANGTNSYGNHKKNDLETNGRASKPSSPTISRNGEVDATDTIKPKPRTEKKIIVEEQEDLLTVLTTRSRSRSGIHVEETSYGKLKSQMSLEDILAMNSSESPSKLPRSQSVIEKNGTSPFASPMNRPTTLSTSAVRRSNSTDLWDESSKIEMNDVAKSKIPMPRNLNRRSSSVTDMKKAFERNNDASPPSGTTSPGSSQPASAAVAAAVAAGSHNRFPSLDSSVDHEQRGGFSVEQFGSISSLASSTSLISQQELAQLVDEANLEEPRGVHDVVVVLLHKDNPTGSVGIILAGGADCETKEITVHRVLSHSVADKEGSVQRGDRILSINGRSMRGLTHRESLAVLKQPRPEVVLVVSRAKVEDSKMKGRTESAETIVEGHEVTTTTDSSSTAWGPSVSVAVYKDGAGLGFSLEGGRDSPLGDRPLLIKKIFTGGAAEKTGALRAGDHLLEVNKHDVSRLSRIEAWSLMKKLPDGEVNLLVRHPATKPS